MDAINRPLLDVRFQRISSSAASSVNARLKPSISKPAAPGDSLSKDHSTRMKKRPSSWSMC